MRLAFNRAQRMLEVCPEDDPRPYVHRWDFDPRRGPAIARVEFYEEDKVSNQRDVIKAFCRWLEIREQHGLSFPGDPEMMAIDAGHSSLLGRLLSGKEPLAEAPPKRMSYPWYELVEHGRADPLEVWIPQEGDAPHEGMIVVDQHFWTIIEVRGEKEWIVAYQTPDTEMIAQCLRDGIEWETRPMMDSKSRWRIYSPGVQGPKDWQPGKPKWIIERFESETKP
jgi:hypothetical protein